MDLTSTREKILQKLEQVSGRLRAAFPPDVIRRTLLAFLARGQSIRMIAQEFDVPIMELVEELIIAEFSLTSLPTNPALLAGLGQESGQQVKRIAYVAPPDSVDASYELVEDDLPTVSEEREQHQRALPAIVRFSTPTARSKPRALIDVARMSFTERLKAQTQILPDPFFGLTPKQQEEARELIPDVYGPGGSEDKVARYRGVTISEIIPEMRVLWLPPSNLWAEYVKKLLIKVRFQRLFNASELGLAMSYLFAVECSQLSLEECARRFRCVDPQYLPEQEQIDTLFLEAYEHHPKSRGKGYKRPGTISGVDQFLDEARLFRLTWKRSTCASRSQLALIRRSS